MLVSYNWLKEYLGDDAPSASDIEQLLTFHAFEIDGVEEEGDDTVFDVDILPNRSSDCLNHRGIAREIATITGKSLAHDPLATSPELPTTEVIEATIEDPNDCPRFTAMLIEGVEIKPSPNWLIKRLEAIGQRSINNIVDATNYVMFALGQPLHAYDAELFPQVNGKWRFGVRKAKAGEMVSLLAEGGKEGDRTVELKGNELLIVDESSNTPVGLAGVKGGRYAGVHEGTTKIIVEAAHFNPTLTRTTARGLGIVIDASKRFENEPSRNLPPYAQAAIAELIKDIAGGKVVGFYDTYPNQSQVPEVSVRAARVNSLLGLSLELPEMIDIVTRLGAVVEETPDGFRATGPFERTDLCIEEDYIEEIGRIHGLLAIKSVVPEPVALTEYNAHFHYTEKIRQTLLAAGFSEVITSSFREKDQVQLRNALASDKSYVRSSLRENIANVLQKNITHTDLLGLAYVSIFEIGTVFEKVEGSISEHTRLALGVRSKASGYTKKDDEPLISGIAALKTLFGAGLPFEIKDGIAEVNLSAFIETLPPPAAYDAYTPHQAAQYQATSPYPAIARDIALWTDGGVDATAVASVLNSSAGDLRVRTSLFDEFEKDGRTSYAFRLVFQSKEKTLTDSEINGVMENVNTAVAAEGWEVR